MTCKGTCDRYKAKRAPSDGRYDNGQKWCNMCSLFLVWEGYNCPCCNYKLRSAPRNRKAKLKLVQRRREKRK